MVNWGYGDDEAEEDEDILEILSDGDESMIDSLTKLIDSLDEQMGEKAQEDKQEIKQKKQSNLNNWIQRNVTFFPSFVGANSEGTEDTSKQERTVETKEDTQVELKVTTVTEVKSVLVVQPEEVLGSTVDTLPATGSPSIEDSEAMIITLSHNIPEVDREVNNKGGLNEVGQAEV